jgi:prephenate dehydrogenase
MKEKKVAIIGLGMLGASIAEKLKTLNCCHEVMALVRRQVSKKHALELGIVDKVDTNPSEILKDADLVVFCTPIPVTIRSIKAYLNEFKYGAILTDIGSTKKIVMNQCNHAIKPRPDLSFIGGHPMAGSEKSGMEFRNSEIYKNAKIFLTPPIDYKEDAYLLIKEMWNLLGASVISIDPELHDEVVAYASQSLHIVAAGAARAVLDHEDGELCAAASAGGFRDLTRIASSNPQMWREILENNPEGNITALSHIIEELNLALRLMKGGQWDKVEQFFAKGKALKDDYLKQKSKHS